MPDFLESVPKGTKPFNGEQEPAFKENYHWENCVGDQTVDPERFYQPETLGELVKIIQIAVKKKRKVRAVSSGHSFTEIVQTADFLLQTHGMNKPIEIEGDLLKEGIDTKFLVQVENGMRLSDLNPYLDSKDLALYNMGAYDAQTIMGIISTSTHGTGVTLGPVAESVASIIIVGDNSQIYRIEPADGMTDPKKYEAKYPGNILMQDDEWFNSVIVSMGCMGIAYSVILKVRESFYLLEDRSGKIKDTHWHNVKKRLIEGSIIEKNKHLEVWINPYKVKGHHRCLVTTRNEVTYEFRVKNIYRRTRNRVQEFLLGLGIVDVATRAIFHFFPKHSPFLIDISMRAVIQKKPYVNKSFIVMNLGAANNIKGFASDYGMSLKEYKPPFDNASESATGDAFDNTENIKHFLFAVERIIANADNLRDSKGIYHSSPFSLRFVNKSRAYLSMMHGEPKCMIEIPMLVWTRGGYEILDGLENEMFKIKARPHWGQHNRIPKRNGLIPSLYPEYEKWIRIYRIINTNGTFDNSFTDECRFRE